MIDFALLLFVPVLFMIGMNRPDRLLLLWLLLSPLSYDTLVVFGLDLRVVSFDRLALLASMGGLLASGRFGELFPSRFSKLEKAIVVFIIVFCLEALVTFSPRNVVSVWTKAFDSFGIPFYLYLLTRYLLTCDGSYNEGLEARIANTLGFVGLYCAAMGIFESITSIDLLPGRHPDGLLLHQSLGKPRANGPFWVAEVLGEYLSFILLFTLYRWRVRSRASSGSRQVSTVRKASYAFLLLAGMYVTMFRNIWIGFLGGYSIRYLFTPKGRTKFLVTVGILGIAAALCWQTITESEIYQKRVSNVDNIYDRLGAWRYSFRAFGEHPLVGIGYGQLKFYTRHAQESGVDLRFNDVEATYHPHNTVIAMLGENGLLLTVPALLMIGYFLGHVRACVRLAQWPEDVEFGLFAVSAAFAMLAPHMTDRCLAWDKYNNLLFVFIAIVIAHHAKLVGSVDVGAAAGTARLGAFVPEPAESLTN